MLISKAYAADFASRRSILPVTGFFVWANDSGKKRRAVVRVQGAPWFSLATLYTAADAMGAPSSERFTILTAPAYETLRPVHDRMPAILSPESCDAWLDPAADLKEARELLGSHDGVVLQWE